MMKKNKKKCYTNIVLILLTVTFIIIFILMGNEIYPWNQKCQIMINTLLSTDKPKQNPVKNDTSCIIEEMENNLILVNKDNKLPDDYKVNLVTIDNVQVAKVLIDDLNEMHKAIEKENILLNIRSAYRTHDDQIKIFDNAVSDYIKQGNQKDSAVKKAEEVVARPGYSEHQTGLAIDFSYGADADKQAVMWEWLNINAYKYGFILRYPEGKEHITGYTFEPWHYRYVGKEHAQIIYDKGILLEDYLNAIK